MSVIKWNGPDSAETLLTTTLNSLANAARKITATPVSNDAAEELDLYGDFQLYLAAQGSARSSGANVTLYILPELDGDYAYGGDSLTPAVGMLVGAFEYDVATTARYAHLRGILLPPTDFHVLVINQTGQAFASSGNVLKLIRYNVQTS